MSLFQYLPKACNPNVSRWKDVPGDGTRKMLSLQSTHSVHGRLGGDKISGSDQISYHIEVRKSASPISENLTVDQRLPLVGFQSSDELRELLEVLKVRQSFSLAAVGDSAFDLRSLAYTIGACLAAASSGCDFDMSQHAPCNVRLLNPTWTLPSVTDLTLAPGVAETGKEFATLARLCGIAGISAITLMADVAPPQTHRTLTGMKLGAFCLKLFSLVMTSAQGCACASLHLQAFFCGLNQHFTLRSHTDEGGWIRGALRNVMYPPSVGVLSYKSSSFMGIPTSKQMIGDLVTKATLGLYLEMVGILVVSDPGTNGDVVTLVKEDSEDRPSSYSTLRPAFYRHMAKFRSLLCEDFDLHISTVGDDMSSEPYWRADLEDRHFKGPVMAPFYWVEPGPLTTKTRDYDMVARQGDKVELPFCNQDSTWKSGGYQEFDGRAVRGSASFVRLKGHKPRMDGMSYLLSQRYRRSNGLSYAEMVVQPNVGVVTTDALFVEPDATILSDRAWITPDNPVRSPMEGRTSNALMVKYTYRGGFGEPNHQDWETGTVASFVSPLFIGAGPGAALKRVVTHASPAHLAWLRNRGAFIPGSAYDVSAFPDIEEADVLHTQEVLPRLPEQPPTQEEMDIEDPEPVSDLPPVQTHEAVEPEIEGLETTVPLDRASGARVILPNVQLEGEEPVGEADSSAPS